MTDPARVEAGWVAERLAAGAARPAAATLAIEATGGRRRTPPALRSACGRSPTASAARRRCTCAASPVPHAYRVFFRHVGLDPDATARPVEAAALDRLMHGGFASRDRLADALLLAVVETGVPVWALDAERARRPAGRCARRGAASGCGEGQTRDDAGRRAPRRRGRRACRSPSLFGRRRPRARRRRARRGPAPASRSSVAGVPAIHVEEALCTCAERWPGPSG